jgi:chemotaxis protein methyltransferase CheR
MRRPSAASDAFVLPMAYRIEDQEFRQFQALVQRETGIQLPESKRALLVGRLSRRLRELGLSSFGAYYRRLQEGDNQEELLRFIDRMATNETSFFREPKQFEFLEADVLPAWTARTRGRRLRAWSAACSTGEEPYSIAMTLLAHLPASDVEVFASDISTRALETARGALWPIERSRQVPERHLKAFMLRGVGEYQGYMKAAPGLREAVRFERLNLHDAH